VCIGGAWVLGSTGHRQCVVAILERLRLHSEPIWAGRENRGRSRPGPQEIGYRKAVANLSIELLERYALKEVSEAERRRVEKHVASCRKCKFILEEQLG